MRKSTAPHTTPVYFCPYGCKDIEFVGNANWYNQCRIHVEKEHPTHIEDFRNLDKDQFRKNPLGTKSFIRKTEVEEMPPKIEEKKEEIKAEPIKQTTESDIEKMITETKKETPSTTTTLKQVVLPQNTEPVQQKWDQFEQQIAHTTQPQFILPPLDEIPEPELWLSTFLQRFPIDALIINLEMQKVAASKNPQTGYFILPMSNELIADIKNMSKDSRMKNDQILQYVKYFYELEMTKYLQKSS